MRKDSSSSENGKIATAALRLAGGKGWQNISFEGLAKTARIPIATLKKRFKTIHEIAPLIAEEIDREAFAASFSGNAHDILFDVLMARFDVMQKHRTATLSMADAARKDRALSFALGRATLTGVYRIIDVVKLKEPPRPVLVAGIAMIYAWTFLVWRKDKSQDMAKTMAALDRGLRLAGKATELLRTCSRSF